MRPPGEQLPASQIIWPRPVILGVQVVADGVVEALPNLLLLVSRARVQALARCEINTRSHDVNMHPAARLVVPDSRVTPPIFLKAGICHVSPQPDRLIDLCRCGLVVRVPAHDHMAMGMLESQACRYLADHSRVAAQHLDAGPDLAFVVSLLQQILCQPRG